MTEPTVDSPLDPPLHPQIAALIAARHPGRRLVIHARMGALIRTPGDVALALGYDESRITKTLLLKADETGRFCLAVLPVYNRASLRVIAARMGAAHCAMATPDELEQILAQPSGGVTPLADADLPVFLDETLRQYDTVLVGGGTRGVEVELAPDDLGVLTGGEWISFSRPSGVTRQSDMNSKPRRADGGSGTAPAI